MTLSISKKNALSVMTMTLTMISLISPADSKKPTTAAKPTTICYSTSPQCCWVKRSWELMGKTTSVSSTSSNACCYYLGSTTQTSGIPGVRCTTTGIVTQLMWQGQGLRNSIPTELENLKNLTYLFLYVNQLSGEIPSSLGNLVNLQTLYLRNNQLSGEIPSSLGQLVNLKDLFLEKNQLSGPIPTSLGQLINLQYLYLGWNQLSGQIPSSLGNLKNLQLLSLPNNQLSGEIPSSLGNLVNLQYLDLGWNQLSGEIPSSLGNLVNLQTLVFQLNPGLNGTFTPQCLTTSGKNVAVYVSGTGATICGCAAASNPPATFPPPGTPDACLATSYTGSTLSKRILAFSQVIGSFKYTCNTDSNKNPNANCLNTMAKICNPSDSSFDKTNCQNGVNEMFGMMNTHWQAVRKECGQWKWTDQSIGNNASSNCASANANLIANAFYTRQDGVQVPVDSGITKSTNERLWSKVTA